MQHSLLHYGIRSLSSVILEAWLFVPDSPSGGDCREKETKMIAHLLKAAIFKLHSIYRGKEKVTGLPEQSCYRKETLGNLRAEFPSVSTLI